MQQKALEKEDIESFEHFMQQKEQCIKAIDEEGILQDISQDANRQELLKMIKVLDDQNRTRFDHQLQEVKDKLRQVRLTQKRGIAYNNPYDISYEEGIFFEKKK